MKEEAMSDDVPIEVACHCGPNGLCDPCSQRELDRMVELARAEDAKNGEAGMTSEDLPGWPPRKTGREGYQQSPKAATKPVAKVDEVNWREISDRLTMFLDPDRVDENIRALADKLDNPA